MARTWCSSHLSLFPDVLNITATCRQPQSGYVGYRPRLHHLAGADIVEQAL